MLNVVTQIGRLVKDVELRYTQSNKAVCNFTIAQDNRFSTNENGEKETNFFHCIAWGGLAENMQKYVGKGSMIGIKGRLQSRSYTKQDGTRKFVTEIVCEDVQFLTFKEKENNDGYKNQQNPTYEQSKHSQQDAFQQFGSSIDIDDSELPFW